MKLPIWCDISTRRVAYPKFTANLDAPSKLGLGGSWKSELLVSATAIASLVGSLAYASASILFANAYGILADDELLEIVSATSELAFGEPYVYRLLLRAPLAQIV